MHIHGCRFIRLKIVMQIIVRKTITLDTYAEKMLPAQFNILFCKVKAML